MSTSSMCDVQIRDDLDAVNIIYTDDGGTLSLSSAPGKQVYSPRNLDEDLVKLRGQGVEIIVCLLEWSEMVRIGIPDYPRRAQEHGFIFYHLAIQDHCVLEKSEDADAVVKLVLQHLSEGHHVLIHCCGGVGRAGTITVCCLCRLGFAPDTAIKLVRSLRKGAVKRNVQVDFVHQYATIHL